MATSFRLPPEQMKRLNYLAAKLGESKAQVVKEALDRFYEEHVNKSKDSVLDRLKEGGFESLSLDLGDLASNEKKQRQVIREKLKKRNRR